ncbi:serine hydrolase [Streptomyces sp. NPDC051569]|uniref:serine hydrolase n=1 Tax=Streptomyces sp. NPDC051569 TaxID=3365661 RepID=UPI00379BB1AE
MDLSVAVGDIAGGRGAGHGEDRTYVTASVVKVAVLVALLLRAGDTGRWLTAKEEHLAAAMIRHSDNDAATALRAALGGVAGLDAAHARLGMTRTSGAPAWGLTRTTARDQLTLLRAVFGRGPELDGRARRFAAGLMERVVPGQAWGVSAAGGDWALKNGWLPRSGSGLWVVHSVGRVRGCLVAVLSAGHATKEDGVARVEEAAVTAVERFLQERPGRG